MARFSGGSHRASSQHAIANANQIGIPVYFPQREASLFGWLHMPRGRSRDVGLILCNPFGYEALGAHRSIRKFAEAFARAGIPALRFDYRGTGDSAETISAENQLPNWTSDIVEAVHELKRCAEVSHVCLVGIRLGGLLALQASKLCKAVDSVILIAPVIDGARYMRELRVTKLAADMKMRSSEKELFSDTRGQNDDLEVNGFCLSHATADALSEIQFDADSVSADVASLIIDGHSLPTSKFFESELQRQKRISRYMQMPGVIQMLMRSPQKAQVPYEIISAACDWLKSRYADCKWSFREHSQYAESSVLEIPAKFSDAAINIIERVALLPADNSTLFGIVSAPAIDEFSGEALIFLNSGVDSHIGANRMHVQFARRWAAKGHLVLRLDLGGIGDSGSHPVHAEDTIYPEEAVSEIQAAVAYMSAHYGARSVILGGLCSGGFHAIEAAIGGAGVRRLFLLNPQQPERSRLIATTRDWIINLSQLLFFQPGRRLFGRELRLIRVFRQNLKLMSVVLQQSLHRLWSSENTLSARVTHITGQGLDVVVCFGENETGTQLLKFRKEISLRQLSSSKLRIHVIKDGDHTFTRREARDRLFNLLNQDLFSSQE